MNDKCEKPVYVGWSARNITPRQRVVLGAQFHMRISEGVDGPVTVTAMALSTSDPAGDSVIFVSCDLGGFRHRWHEENNFLPLCREAIRERSPEIDVNDVILNATHTHTAPNALVDRYGETTAGEVELPEDVMTAEEYMKMLHGQIADAAVEAWESRQPAGVSWGLGTAVVGHNRRATYFREDSGRKAGAVVGGRSRMYGNTNDPDFSHIEGCEDHYVDLLYTWGDDNKLTGVVVNIACPSQETEGFMYVSSDFWHEVRTEIRHRHGDHIQVLPQCAAAGDQSPHRLWYKGAEDRMLKLRGLTMRQEIGRRIADAVDDVLAPAGNDIRRTLPLKHLFRPIEIPRLMVTDEEAEETRADLAELEAEAKKGEKTFRLAQRCRRVLQRYRQQKESTTLTMDLHVIRLGDVAFATNRFELFLDYGIRMKARSPAVQTFVVQLAANDGWPGTYLPSERAFANRGYGSGAYSNEVGPKGGQVIVEETVKALDELWEGAE